MSSRERMLLLVGGGAVVFMVVFVCYAFVWSPLEEAWERGKQANEELSKTEKEFADAARVNGRILKNDPRLMFWKEMSLPPTDPAAPKTGRGPAEQKERHLSKLRLEYERYLSNLMRASGFKGETIRVTFKTPDKRGGGASLMAKKKEVPLFERLAFGVTAQGTQDAVYRAMRDFYTTPVLHQVRDFLVSVAKPKGRNKPDPNVLEFSMTAEALIMKGGEARSTVMTPKALPTTPRVLAMPSRDYLVLKKHSLFTGKMKPPPEKVKPKERDLEKEKPKETGPSERDRLAVLESVKLTMVAWNPVRRRWEATLYDQAQGKGDEIKVDTRLYKTFSIEDENEKVMLDARVISITEDELIFQAANKKVYRARCGDFFDAVWKNPLSDEELRKLGLKKG